MISHKTKYFEADLFPTNSSVAIYIIWISSPTPGWYVESAFLYGFEPAMERERETSSSNECQSVKKDQMSLHFLFLEVYLKENLQLCGLV